MYENNEQATPVVAVIPAAGHGTRLGNAVSGSKEIADVGGQPAILHLLRRLSLAGIDRAFIVLRAGKWDVPTALVDADRSGVDLAYAIVDDTPSQLASITEGLALIDRELVALAYPDVLFEPEDAFASLLSHLVKTGADLVLGLFPSETPERVDMVALDEKAKPVEIVIKQPDHGLRYSWCIAVWRSAFSRYLNDYVDRSGGESSEYQPDHHGVELCAGHAIQSVLDGGLSIESVLFDEGVYIDIGTPEALTRARQLYS